MTDTELQAAIEHSLPQVSVESKQHNILLEQLHTEVASLLTSDTDSVLWLLKLMAIQMVNLKTTLLAAVTEAETVVSQMRPIKPQTDKENASSIAALQEAKNHLQVMRTETGIESRKRRANLAAKALTRAATWGITGKSLYTPLPEARTRLISISRSIADGWNKVLALQSQFPLVLSESKSTSIVNKINTLQASRAETVTTGLMEEYVGYPRRSTTRALALAGVLVTDKTRDPLDSKGNVTFVPQAPVTTAFITGGVEPFTILEVNKNFNLSVNGATAVTWTLPYSTAASIETANFNTITVSYDNQLMGFYLNGTTLRVIELHTIGLLDPAVEMTRTEVANAINSQVGDAITCTNTGTKLIITSNVVGSGGYIKPVTVHPELGLVANVEVRGTDVLTSQIRQSASGLGINVLGGGSTAIKIESASKGTDSKLALSGSLSSLGITSGTSVGKTLVVVSQTEVEPPIRVNDVVESINATVKKVSATSITLDTPVNSDASFTSSVVSPANAQYSTTIKDLSAWKGTLGNYATGVSPITNALRDLGRDGGYGRVSLALEQLRPILVQLGSIMEDFKASPVPSLTSCIKRYKAHSFNRAADLLSGGYLEKLMSVTVDDASYSQQAASSISKAAQEIPASHNDYANAYGVVGNPDIEFEDVGNTNGFPTYDELDGEELEVF